MVFGIAAGLADNNHMILQGEAKPLNLRLNMGLNADTKDGPCQLEIKMNVTDYKKTDPVSVFTPCVSQ